jgi:hypothetical protein
MYHREEKKAKSGSGREEENWEGNKKKKIGKGSRKLGR